MSRTSIHCPGRKNTLFCCVLQDNGFTDYELTHRLVFELSAWCRINLEYGSYSEEKTYNSAHQFDGIRFEFGSDEDAMGFKLAWSE